MPKRCRDCVCYNNGYCDPPYHQGRDSVLRGCVNASISQLTIRENSDVLEIGCGYREQVQNLVQGKNARWMCADPLAFKRNRVNTVKDSVLSLSFENESFDYVIAVQTVEHWHEQNDGYHIEVYEAALSEIWRVLRPAGRLMIDTPIGLHGNQMFVSGDIAPFVNLFTIDKWKQISCEEWGKDRSDLVPERGGAYTIMHQYEKVHVPSRLLML